MYNGTECDVNDDTPFVVQLISGDRQPTMPVFTQPQDFSIYSRTPQIGTEYERTPARGLPYSRSTRYTQITVDLTTILSALSSSSAIVLVLSYLSSNLIRLQIHFHHSAPSSPSQTFVQHAQSTIYTVHPTRYEAVSHPIILSRLRQLQVLFCLSHPERRKEDSTMD